MKTVKDLLRAKGYDAIWAVAPDDSVYDALKLMANKNVGAVLVMDADHLVGILSERDYARKVIYKGKSPEDTPVHEIMTKKVICADPDCTVEEALNVMTDKRIRHLPIMVGDDLVGIVSIGDCVKDTIRRQEVQITHLKEYITDSYPGPANSAD